MTFLRDRDWQFPIRELDGKVYQSFSPMEAEKFIISLGSVMREWHFLFLIWNRLQIEHKNRLEALEERLSLGKRIITQLEDSGLTRKFMHNSDLIHLDTEDFLIHAKILLDGLVYLTKTFFIDRIVEKGSEPPDGFTRFRKWFKEEKNSILIIDSELAEFIKVNTDWYEELQYARDKLIVHRKGYHTDVLREEDKVIVIGKAKTRFDEVKNIVDWQKIEDMPDLNNLVDNITELLHFYDKHFTQMLEKSN